MAWMGVWVPGIDDWVDVEDKSGIGQEKEKTPAAHIWRLRLPLLSISALSVTKR
jgi:hypothetical protein